MAEVGIIMGSDSDLPVMALAESVLSSLGVSTEITVVSAHRTPDRLFEYAKSAVSRGLKVLIAGAGGAAHLPGMAASMTVLPVIGVPIKTKALNGLDSLLSIVQMPGGIPVATVAIDGGKNAGLLAAKILALSQPGLSEKLLQFMADQESEVLEKAHRLETIGAQDYLAQQNKE